MPNKNSSATGGSVWAHSLSGCSPSGLGRLDSVRGSWAMSPPLLADQEAEVSVSPRSVELFSLLNNQQLKYKMVSTALGKK